MTHAGASWPALGSTAAVAVTEPAELDAARRAVEDELGEIDAACSRFRDDSELVRLNAARGEPIRVSRLLFDAIAVALRAARATRDLVDPTVGASMDAIGYDRDFGAISRDGPPIQPLPAAGWRSVRLDPAKLTVQLPQGVRLDLGSTAKAWAADRAVARAGRAVSWGTGVLVSLGGDIAVAGAPPHGWPIAIADDHGDGAADTTIAVDAGGLATSSTAVRRWRRGGQAMHHIVDPATGRPVATPWRTVSVAAASCADANAASTAALVLGVPAPDWLAALGLPARLVGVQGHVTLVGGWPVEVEAEAA